MVGPDRGQENLLLQGLEGAAARLGVAVRYEEFRPDDFPTRSGSCLLHGQRLIIIDKSLPVRDRIQVLAQELGHFDLEQLYLVPEVRELLHRHPGEA